MSLINILIKIVYKNVLKPILFLFDPEWVHDRFIASGRFFSKSKFFRTVFGVLWGKKYPRLSQQIAGLLFDSPIGLSAGFDKEGYITPLLSSLGFGFGQVGSLTLHPYDGNPKPRLYRLKKSQGIVVNYGLKNQGVHTIAKRLKEYKTIDIPVSISIAKTNSDKTCDLDAGINDYLGSYNHLLGEEVGDIYTINISCPNTFGGEPFTTPDKLNKLLFEWMKRKTNKPTFLKMPISLKREEFDALTDIAVQHGVTGVIIGNLQKDFSSSVETIPPEIKGGMSGKPTELLSNTHIKATSLRHGDKLVIVGVGGVFTALDAYTKIRLGASLIQLVTGMIFCGPQVIHEINSGLDRLLIRDGFSHVSEAVGVDCNKKVDEAE